MTIIKWIYTTTTTTIMIMMIIITTWLRVGRLESEFESRYGQEFSFFHVVQTDPGSHPVSYAMVTEGSFPGVK
jgi:hypothetical protein